jgi:hypothetical protein
MVRGRGGTGLRKAEEDSQPSWVYTGTFSYCAWLLIMLHCRSRDENGVEMGLGAIGPVALGTAKDRNPNRYRLERFGKAMSGSVSWEVPSAVLNGTFGL